MILALLPFVMLTPPAGEAAWRQPQLATDGRIAVVAFGSGDTVYAAVSKDGGRNFAAPVKVGAAGVMYLGRHRGPRVAVSGQSIVIAAIAGAKGKGQDGELRAWRSTDGGSTWSSPVTVTDVPGAAREGLHTLASGPDGTLVAAWLDLRHKGMRLAASISKDGGANWSRNAVIYESPDGHICECCHPSAAIGADGSIRVMFRNWLDESRDMWVATSHDGGKTFQSAKSGEGTWKLNACPMDGGGVAVRKNGTMITVWRREKNIYWTDGERFVNAQWSGKDPAVALAAGEKPLLIWTDGNKVMFSDNGAAPVELDANGAYPSVAASGAVSLAAWETGTGIRVQALR